MGPPCNTSPLGRRSRRANKLNYEPYGQKEEGGELQKIGDKEDRNKGKDPGPRVEQEIGAHDAGNGAARANGGDLGVPVQKEMGEPGSKPAQEIEGKVPDGTQAILHVIAEDVKGPHVHEDVPEPAMNEHVGKE